MTHRIILKMDWENVYKGTRGQEDSLFQFAVGHSQVIRPWMPKDSGAGILSVKDTHAVQMCWEDAFARSFRVQYMDTSVYQALM